ncbi:MAG: flavin-containing monooxygenase [Allosphingosinicella sp.]|uniref:flavin-containing monooxygenase n=1 Tax=Allosphingosinicella sp. TaxID=2823234 RepID=UPI00392ECA54
MADLQMLAETAFPEGRPEEDLKTFIRRAVDQANLNALRLALFQITGDPELAAMKVVQKSIRGGALLQEAVADEDIPRLKEKVVDYLLNPPASVPPPPSKEETVGLIKLFNSQEKSENFIRFAIEELALEDYPRDVQWTNRPSQQVIDNFKVLVIGGGISGIGAAIQLKKLGIPYRVIERQSDIGGTWQLNNYPEARVDTSSYLYQFKFEKNYPWTEFFAARDETKRYLNHVAERHGILPDFQFDTEVVAAQWDEDDALWHATLRHKDGREEQVSANVIISGSGLFSTPNLPDIPGAESFGGAMFHTAQWDHGFDYAGKRVALIGTGSSGTQLMPAIAKAAEHLTVYQRTANWIMKLEGYRAPVSREARWLFDNMPYYWNWYCYASFDTAMHLQDMQTYDRDYRERTGGINKRNDDVKQALTDYLKNKLGEDSELFRKCLPKYPPLARRLVVDNGFYDALLQDNVDLVTDRIERITPNGILSADGEEREFDLIVIGAGFQTSRYLHPVNYVGRGGMTLDKAWEKDGARSYLGIAMPDFPNLFMFYGPNGQPRSGGFYSWAEIWSRYAAGMIVHMLENGHRSAAVRRDVFDAYNEDLDEAMKQVLWELEGAGGYYNNEFGRCGVNVPFLTEDYHAMVAEPKPGDYDLR